MPTRIQVTVTYAQSLDGRIATRTGDSQWISGPETLHLAQTLRRDHGAIAVGINTVLRDDPALTCRLPQSRSPLRVVFDSDLRIPSESQIARTAGEYPSLVLAGPGAEPSKIASLRAMSLSVVQLPLNRAGGIDIDEALSTIHEHGAEELLVEGGRQLITSFLVRGVVDRMLVVTAPLLIGEGVSALGDLEVRNLDEALRPRVVKVGCMGDDVVWELSLHG